MRAKSATTHLNQWILFVTSLFLLIVAFQTIANADANRKVGTFSMNEMKSLTMGCEKKQYSAIELANANSSCEIRVKTVSVQYDGGFTQFYDFPSVGQKGGAPLQRQVLTVLPGTRCLKGLSMDAKADKGCLAKVSVSVVR